MRGEQGSEIEYIREVVDHYGILEGRRSQAWPARVSLREASLRPGGLKIDPITGTVGRSRTDLAKRWQFSRFLILIGDPGMGKSTTLSHLLLEVSEFGTGTNQVVPYLVSMAALGTDAAGHEWSALSDLVWSSLDSRWKTEQLRRVFDRALLEGRAAFLIDDFDALLEPRRGFARLASEFCKTDGARGNRLIVASRTAEYLADRRNFVGFEEYLISGFY